MSKKTIVWALIEIRDALLGSGGGGGGGGGSATSTPILVVHETNDHNVYTLDKTWQEIYDAMDANEIIVVISSGGDDIDYWCTHAYVTSASYNYDEIKPLYLVACSGTEYGADSANGYPYYEDELG